MGGRAKVERVRKREQCNSIIHRPWNPCEITLQDEASLYSESLTEKSSKCLLNTWLRQCDCI